ncbi:spore germination protein [Mediterraneibacter glycyrrhizinilyticus]|uniref:spore germination protein n=1 Tax=Mediterraneibacter glycyrrhizinilyticus TaxID=342942 RepID=UPI001D08EA0F|nr:spore germination protein [Mediterraneibacter glycyrrhizinilyticus]MCB6309119.1 spore germination protein [Lachnospiraceae bacterium 210521-DFI.1.109]MCB6426465.1 spore germination protein [Mediterraneibacter glycyrrhizinilyticus]
MVEKDTKKVGRSFRENIAYLEQILPVKESFDMVRRDMEIGERAATFYFIDGFTKDESMLKIMDSLFSVKAEDMPEDGTTFARRHIPYVEVDLVQSFDEVFRNLLSGATCLFIEGYEVCFVIDCRTYPARSVDEPDKDKSLRGSRDGFVETIVFNTALLRRRIRDANLVMEMTEAGQTSRTDIAICYMKDRVDPELLKNVSSRIEKLQIDDLRMNQQSLAEALFKRKWFNPFPKFKFTERPDTAAACLLEGKIVILVDNSPSAMILPTSIYDMVEEANDYYFPTITRVYLKFSRALITFGTVFLTPVYLLFMQNLEWLPEMFRFTVVQEPVYVPLIFQFLLLELSIDGLRLAAMNTPSMLSTPLSVIAGLVMGEFAVSSGWFNAEIMLGMAFVAVANYTQPNFELGYALKFMRLMLLILTACFNGTGFAVGCVLVVCFLAFNKTLSGRNYLNVKLN